MSITGSSTTSNRSRSAVSSRTSEPAQLSNIARAQFMHSGPAPIQHLVTLSRLLSRSGACHVFIAREDLSTNVTNTQGSKTRKLEYILPVAVAEGADTIVTEGGFQSTHTRQVAAIAAHMGLKCQILVSDWTDHDDHSESAIANYAAGMMGAEVRYIPKVEAGQAPKRVIEELKAQGHKIHWIPSGASAHQYGGVGYARWMYNVLRNREPMLKKEGKLKGSGRFDFIFVVVISGSTLGGMIAGMKLYEHLRVVNGWSVQDRKIIGIDASGKSGMEQREMVLGIARRTARLVGLDEEEITPTDVNVDTRWNVGAFGKCDQVTADSVKDLASMEGVITDPIYTGKGMAGLMHAVKENEVSGNVLFVHTGGRSALEMWKESQLQDEVNWEGMESYGELCAQQ